MVRPELVDGRIIGKGVYGNQSTPSRPPGRPPTPSSSSKGTPSKPCAKLKDTPSSRGCKDFFNNDHYLAETLRDMIQRKDGGFSYLANKKLNGDPYEQLKHYQLGGIPRTRMKTRILVGARETIPMFLVYD